MIVVTAPTGAIGHQVVSNLLAAGEQVRVIVRDPAKLPEQIRDQVEVVPGSHGDPAVVAEAFAGGDAVFWLAPPGFVSASLDDVYLDFARPAVEAFKTQGVARVVDITALGRGTPLVGKAGLVTASLAMDDLIAGSGVAFRGLACPSFMDNMLRQVVPIKTQGVFFSPIISDLKMPTCSTGDIAATAARLLSDPSWSGTGEVAVLGPENLSNDDMAAVMTEVLGKPVRAQHIPADAFRKSLTDRGMSQAVADGTVDMMVAKNEGLDLAAPRTPESSTPTTFRTWCETVLKPAVDAA